MVYLTVVRRVSRLEVVRRWGTADMVASWVPEDACDKDECSTD